MKTDGANVRTVDLPQQSKATKSNIGKLKVYLNKDGKVRQNSKQLVK